LTVTATATVTVEAYHGQVHSAYRGALLKCTRESWMSRGPLGVHGVSHSLDI
jgi:hypothetical protein